MITKLATWRLRIGASFYCAYIGRTLKNFSSKLTDGFIKHCETVYEKNGNNLIRTIKNSTEILYKLKSKGFLPSIFSIYDFLFSILYWLITLTE